jgi:hypothetical protein
VATPKTQQDALGDISEKLDSVLGFMAIKGIEGDAGKVVVRLRDLGLSAKCIARVSGMTENAVAIRFSRMNKPKAKKTGKKSTKDAAHAAPGPVSSTDGDAQA